MSPTTTSPDRPSSTVEPSTSGPWCAARPSTRPASTCSTSTPPRPPSPPPPPWSPPAASGSPSPRQRGDGGEPLGDLVLVVLALEALGLGAVLVGVAEHADGVDPGRREEVTEHLAR